MNTNLGKSITNIREEEVRTIEEEKAQYEPIREIVDSVTKIKGVNSCGVYVGGRGGGS